jgi:hypothetical protein
MAARRRRGGGSGSKKFQKICNQNFFFNFFFNVIIPSKKLEISDASQMLTFFGRNQRHL